MRTRWATNAAVWALYLSTLVPLSYLTRGTEWVGWYLGFGGMVFAIGAIGRAAGRSDRRVGLYQVLALPLAQIAAFAGDVSWFLVIPNSEVWERFWSMGQALGRSFLQDMAPLRPQAGLFALIAISGGLLAWALDWYAVVLKAPAATGMFACLVLVVTVAFVRSGLPVLAMAPTAAAYLLLLAVSAPRARPRFAAAAVVAGGVALGLAASAAPGLGIGALVKGGEDWTISFGDVVGSGTQTVGGDDVLVDVARDLKERDRFEVLRYATTAEAPVYLRLTSLGAFDGSRWERVQGPEMAFAVPTDDGQPLTLDEPLEARGALQRVAVELTGLESDWLPAPYMPVHITGMRGRVLVDSADLTVRLADPIGEGSRYVVLAAPAASAAEAAVAQAFSYEQLYGPLDGTWAAVYLDLPPGMPAVIGETARGIVAPLANSPEIGDDFAGSLAYNAALALVDHFQTAGFSYSLDSPVDFEDGSDQGQAVAEFLSAKSGYCVHFAVAMTLMARELGIPARVAVGYAPGVPLADAESGSSGLGSGDGAVQVYSVGADQLHSWPELYIEGMGWVGFEPTVAADSAALSGVSSAASPSGSPSSSAASPSASGASGASGGPTAAASPSGDASGPADSSAKAARPSPIGLWAAGVFGVLALMAALPGFARGLVRRRRLHAGLAGVWDEVRATAQDLGLAPPPWRTPADVGASLGAVLRG
ncbi:MAG: DUF3488 and transglutaminase-like domain-containing protein, partial [Bifidobacteriaceae bacterium]|nr:DUF3488 and transglutaminase-like domain-containing protein [Bifidobacteriaceae bacterium]